MGLSINLRQRQTLSPQIIQTIKILQMGSVELRDYLQEQLQENPVLEVDECISASSSPQNSDRDQLLQKLEWIHSTDVQNGWYNREDGRDLIELVPGTDPNEESLYDHLCAQIHFKDLPPSIVVAVKCVLQSLDHTGRLDESPEALAAHAGVSVVAIQSAIQLVQSLEPAGVAARDLSECLCLQLARRGENGLALTIAQNYLEQMSQNHYSYIAKTTGASREEIQSACQLIRSLDPRPGIAFAPREDPGYIIPDVAVIAEEDRLEVILHDSYIPCLRVSSYYYKLMETTDDREVLDYLSTKVRQAKWMVQNVERWRATLLSCVSSIVARQEDFFRQGSGHLRPMSLADVAAIMNVHESTISRTVQNKYLQCSRGVFPLKYFFNRAVPTVNGETDMSAERAKSALSTLINGENKKKPMSDQKLSELLASQGVQLSRRTVAKYRDELGIPSTAGRRNV